MMRGGPMQQTEKILSLAKRQFNRREYHLAEDLVNFVLKDDANNLDARLLLAKILDAAGRRGLAITELEIIRRLSRKARQNCPEADAMLRELDRENADLASNGDAAGANDGAPEFQKMGAKEGDPWNAIRASRGISPYFGFSVKIPGEHLNNYGFAVPNNKKRIDYPYTPAADEFVVAIFGDSVASEFCQDEALTIEESLARHPDLKGRTPVVLNFAAGSLKQPQQPIYLNYFLGLGQKFDLVINIDGFNDVPGAIANCYHGYHPAKPQAMLLKSFDAIASVARLDRASLKYFSHPGGRRVPPAPDQPFVLEIPGAGCRQIPPSEAYRPHAPSAAGGIGGGFAPRSAARRRAGLPPGRAGNPGGNPGRSRRFMENLYAAYGRHL